MKPVATVSVDLDNLWSYLKVHGDPGWESFPSYLDLAVPRILELLEVAGLRSTFFIVGQDAALPGNRAALKRIPAAGHEVGNHSFRHEPWLHRYTPEEVAGEILRAEDAIGEATGIRTRGFRGPGFSLSAEVLRVLAERGYRYDASTFPTFLGPVARAWYFLHANLRQDQKQDRQALFGGVAEGFRPLGPYLWRLQDATLLEIPVTTVPGVRLPFHLSYVLFLQTFSEALGRAYFRAALATCRATGVEPSILIHPLDALGGDEVPGLAFFPAMDIPGAVKRRRTAALLADLAREFEVRPLGAHAEVLATRDLPQRTWIAAG